MMTYPNFTRSLAHVVKVIEAKGDVHKATLSVRAKLHRDAANVERRKYNKSVNKSVVSLPYPDLTDAAAKLIAAWDRHVKRSGKDAPFTHPILKTVKSALEEDLPRRLVNDSYRGKKGRALYQPHVNAALAVFSSHGLSHARKNKLSAHQFLQSWSSKALGFNDIYGGEPRPTLAYTTVIFHPDGQACVFFDDRFAYYLPYPNSTFQKDLTEKQLAAVSDSLKYRKLNKSQPT